MAGLSFWADMDPHGTKQIIKGRLIGKNCSDTDGWIRARDSQRDLRFVLVFARMVSISKSGLERT